MASNRLGVIACAILCASSGLASAATIPALSYIGQHIIPTGTVYNGTVVGGLSGIDYDARDGSYWAISDDRSATGPARFYNLDFDFNSAGVNGVTFNSVTNLLTPGGATFGTNQVDPEAIRLDPTTGRFFWSSEGERNGADLQNPFVREMNADGSYVRELATPSYYNASANDFGIRRNLAFESLSLSTDGNTVYTATENALFQDGAAASISDPSPSRVLAFDKATGAATAEYIYITEPVSSDSVPPGGFVTNGLVEILAINETEFLAVERSFSVGVGNEIKIYLASIDGATNILGEDTAPGATVAMSKTLLFDFGTVGIVMDNIEGISLGPVLDNGNLSVVLVSDNNFSSGQFTQFIALEVVPTPGAGALLGLAMVVTTRRRR